MKTALSGIFGLLIIATVVFAQNLDKNDNRIADKIEYIKQETIGGKLDFTFSLKESDYPTIEHKGVRFNRNDYHVFLWGQAVRDLGLESSAKASSLWEEIHGKKLTGPQRTALRIGFDKELK